MTAMDILPIKDDESKTSDESSDITIRTDPTFTFPDRQVLTKYVATKLPRLDNKAFSFNFLLDPFGQGDPDSPLSCYQCGFPNAYYGDVVDDDRENVVEMPSNGGAITFGPVRIREYNRTVGDHPDVSDDGPPLTLDWEYVEYKRIPISDYEDKKARRRERRMVRREATLRQKQLDEGVVNPVIEPLKNVEFYCPRLKGSTRQELLHQEFGVPLVELREALAEAQRVSKQRDESNAQSAFSEKTEELLEIAARRLKRSFSFVKKNKGSNNSASSNSIISSGSTLSSKSKKHPLLRRKSSSSLDTTDEMFTMGSIGVSQSVFLVPA